MKSEVGRSVLDYFAELPDPRVARSRRNFLLDSIAIALCAALCGANSWVHGRAFRQEQAGVVGDFLGVAQWDARPRHFWGGFLPLGSGAISGLLCSLDPDDCPVAAGDVVAVDSKTAPVPMTGRQGRAASGQPLGFPECPNPGSSQDGRQIQRNHGHPPAVGTAGTEGMPRKQRRDGRPAGQCPSHCESGGGLLAGG